MPKPVTPGKERNLPSSRGTWTGIAAAEFALKAHALCDAETMGGVDNGSEIPEEISLAINLTEAPEDAVCSLIIDLMRYCEQEKIDWTEDVMARALRPFTIERCAQGEGVKN